MKLRYTERSKDDLEYSTIWYEKQQRGLGLEFLNCIEKSILLIIENPTMYRYFHSNFRGCVISKFPFVIYFTIEENEIVVHSIFDSRQDPVKRP